MPVRQPSATSPIRGAGRILPALQPRLEQAKGIYGQACQALDRAFGQGLSSNFKLACRAEYNYS
jgi:hypothetical protein